MQERLQLNFAQRWKEKLSKPQQVLAKKTSLILGGVLVVLLMVLIGSLPWVYKYKLESELAEADHQIAALKDIESQAIQLEDLRNQVANQQQILDLIKKHNSNPSEVLDQLRKHLPLGTVVNSFVLNADQTVNLSLTLPSPIDVARVWESIDESNLFQPIDVKTVQLLDKAQPLNLTLKLK